MKVSRRKESRRQEHEIAIRTGKTIVRFHFGYTIRDIAATYPKLIDAVMELIQNAIDANATRVWVAISPTTKYLSVEDNGSGRTEEDFNKALQQVNKSVKTSDKLGRFGKGLVSPLGKCTYFTFTSCPAPAATGYVQWTLRTKDLFESQLEPHIPFEERADLAFGTKEGGRQAVPWRTQVAICGYNPDDKLMSNVSLSELEKQILGKYSKAMRQKGVVVSLKLFDAEGKETKREVKPSNYGGTPLKEIVLTEGDAGETRFRLFLVRPGQAGLGVFVGEAKSAFTIPWLNFSAQTRQQVGLSEDVIRFFQSGHVEGEILSEKCQYHAERNRFQQDAALYGFCATLEQWYEVHGKSIATAAQDRSQAKRYEEIGNRTLARLRDLLKKVGDRFPLSTFIEQVKLGTVGAQHFPPKETLGVDGVPGIAVQGRGGKGGKDDGDGSGGGRVRTPPHGEHKKHTPFIIGSVSRGRIRHVVRDDSLGVKLEFFSAEDENVMWESTLETGTIRINDINPFFAMCFDCSDRVFQLYMDNLVIAAINTTLQPAAFRAVQQSIVEENLKAVAQLYSNMDARQLPG